MAAHCDNMLKRLNVVNVLLSDVMIMKLKTLEIVFPPSLNFDSVTKLSMKWSKWSIINVCVLCSMCRFGHAAWGGQWCCQQQGEERQCEWAGGERRHGVWCGALPVGADGESSAALPSSASRLHASKFGFLSHTATCNLVCLIQWMFNGAEQPFILLWRPYLCHRGFKLFVCTLCLCVSMYVLNQCDFQGSES